MIAVLMGDQDSRELGRGDAEAREPPFGLAQRKPAIEQDAGAAAGDERAVAAAAAAE
jgi:hypothetical protein